MRKEIDLDDNKRAVVSRTDYGVRVIIQTDEDVRRHESRWTDQATLTPREIAKVHVEAVIEEVVYSELE
jgi:hypothetical protein